MKKEDLIKEFNKLKLKINTNKNSRYDLDNYNDWVDKVFLLKNKKWDYYNQPESNKKYVLYKTMYGIVSDLFYKKHSDKKSYHKHKQEIQEIIREVIEMMMFVQERTLGKVKK